MQHLQVQPCGCIALPANISEALLAGPGSVLEVELKDGALILRRISPPLDTEAQAATPLAACPLR